MPSKKVSVFKRLAQVFRVEGHVFPMERKTTQVIIEAPTSRTQGLTNRFVRAGTLLKYWRGFVCSSCEVDCGIFISHEYE